LARSLAPFTSHAPCMMARGRGCDVLQKNDPWARSIASSVAKEAPPSLASTTASPALAAAPLGEVPNVLTGIEAMFRGLASAAASRQVVAAAAAAVTRSMVAEAPCPSGSLNSAEPAASAVDGAAVDAASVITSASAAHQLLDEKNGHHSHCFARAIRTACQAGLISQNAAAQLSRLAKAADALRHITRVGLAEVLCNLRSEVTTTPPLKMGTASTSPLAPVVASSSVASSADPGACPSGPLAGLMSGPSSASSSSPMLGASGSFAESSGTSCPPQTAAVAGPPVVASACSWIYIAAVPVLLDPAAAASAQATAAGVLQSLASAPPSGVEHSAGSQHPEGTDQAGSSSCSATTSAANASPMEAKVHNFSDFASPGALPGPSPLQQLLMDDEGIQAEWAVGSSDLVVTAVAHTTASCDEHLVRLPDLSRGSWSSSSSQADLRRGCICRCTVDCCDGMLLGGSLLRLVKAGEHSFLVEPLHHAYGRLYYVDSYAAEVCLGDNIFEVWIHPDATLPAAMATREDRDRRTLLLDLG
jgi:hypothetical protein